MPTTVMVLEPLSSARVAVEDACRRHRMAVTAAEGCVESHAYDMGLVAVACRDRRSWANAEALISAGATVVAMIEGKRPAADLEALSAGASGTVDRSAPPAVIARAAQAAARGEAVLPVEVLRAMTTLVPEPTHEVPLEADDQALLEQVITGATTAKIAHDLHVSERTVHLRLQQLYTTLRVSSRAEAIAVAVDRGLVAPR